MLASSRKPPIKRGVACEAATWPPQRAAARVAEAKIVELAVVDQHANVGAQEGAPIVVLVHGLDSWSGTWSSVAQELAHRGLGSVAIDLRGHGLSPMGDPVDFGPAQLAADVRAALCRVGVLPNKDAAGRSAALQRRVVLVGHSMGGKVVMRFAANYPEDLAALVVEDMDCRAFSYAPEVLEPGASERQRRRAFERAFPSWEACKSELETFGYESGRIDDWRLESPPRVMPMPRTALAGSSGVAVWSAINPHAQWMARLTVLTKLDSYEALQHLALLRGGDSKLNFPVHVFVAGPAGTVCKWETLPGGIWDMQSVLPGLVVSSFPDAFHSIHNSKREAFVDAVEKVARPVVA